MPLFKITHREELVDEFFYEALSDEAAMEMYRNDVEQGWIDFNRMEMVDSSDEVEEVEKDDRWFHPV